MVEINDTDERMNRRSGSPIRGPGRRPARRDDTEERRPVLRVLVADDNRLIVAGIRRAL